MARAKKKAPAFTGRWHIVSMTEWEDAQAFIEFDAIGTGKFQVGLVQGNLAYRTTRRMVGQPWSGHGRATPSVQVGAGPCSSAKSCTA